MAQRSRPKTKRAVRSAKRSRNNSMWYALTAIIVILGIAVIVFTKANRSPEPGPYILDQANQTNPHNRDSHWHAALGVYDCDHWMSDGSGDGVWAWPYATPSGSPARAGNTNVYAGLHSHGDGIIHMEPSTSEEAGKNATVGKYFQFGGWKLSSDGYSFLGTTVKNGDTCGTGAKAKPGKLVWGLAKWDGNTTSKQKLTVETGNPGSYKLYNDDIVVIAFLPDGTSIDTLPNPPSVANLAGAENREGQQMPSVNTTVPGAPPGSTVAGSTPTTASGATPTSKP